MHLSTQHSNMDPLTELLYKRASPLGFETDPDLHIPNPNSGQYIPCVCMTSNHTRNGHTFFYDHAEALKWKKDAFHRHELDQPTATTGPNDTVHMSDEKFPNVLRTKTLLLLAAGAVVYSMTVL